MANSASLLLPVSNLTNLLAMRYLDLTFLGFASVMAPVLVVVLAIEYVAASLLFRRVLALDAPDKLARLDERVAVWAARDLRRRSISSALALSLGSAA